MSRADGLTDPARTRPDLRLLTPVRPPGNPAGTAGYRLRPTSTTCGITSRTPGSPTSTKHSSAASPSPAPARSATPFTITCAAASTATRARPKRHARGRWSPMPHWQPRRRGLVRHGQLGAAGALQVTPRARNGRAEIRPGPNRRPVPAARQPGRLAVVRAAIPQVQGPSRTRAYGHGGVPRRAGQASWVASAT